MKCQNCNQELEKDDLIRIKNYLHCKFCLAKVKRMKEVIEDANNYAKENKNQGLTSSELYDMYKSANRIFYEDNRGEILFWLLIIIGFLIWFFICNSLGLIKW